MKISTNVKINLLCISAILIFVDLHDVSVSKKIVLIIFLNNFYALSSPCSSSSSGASSVSSVSHPKETTAAAILITLPSIS